MATKKITKKAMNEKTRFHKQFFFINLGNVNDDLQNTYKIVNTNLCRHFFVDTLTIDNCIAILDSLGRTEDANWTEENSYPN